VNTDNMNGHHMNIHSGIHKTTLYTN